MRYVAGLALLWFFLIVPIQAQNVKSLIPTQPATTTTSTNKPAVINSINGDNNLNTAVLTSAGSSQSATKSTEATPVTIIDKDILQSAPLVNIEVIGTGISQFKMQIPPPPPPSLLEKAAKIQQEALFQRKRFDETLQPIEMESNRLYYRRDAYSYTKGIILFKFMQNKMDFGIYRQNTSPASTTISGSVLPEYSSPESNGVVFRNGSKLFFGLRMRLPMH